MSYSAHIRKDAFGNRHTQSVEEHCKNCARYASQSAPDGLGQTAYLAGLLHDMGKYTDSFQSYLTMASDGEKVRRGSVNHTFAGVRFAMERWHSDGNPFYHNLTGEILAFAIGAHHGQFDCIAPDGTDGFLHRISEEKNSYGQARENFLQYCADLRELEDMFEVSVREISQFLDHCKTMADRDSVNQMFYLSMVARQVLSAVIEGDRRDTAEFMQTAPSGTRSELDKERWGGRLAAVESRILRLPADSQLNQVRRDISQRCRDAARRGTGIYRLTVPTGGGKTLTALRYALAQASMGKGRIFFVIPLLSILEQNAARIREYLEEDSIVLEHHSNVLQEKRDGEKLDLNELLMENWRAPVVITTLVQLLNTLFAGQTSCIRRMNALQNSVIVIDEVQSIPRNMLSQFNLAMNFLSEACGATVVLCSATQPPLERVKQHCLHCSDPQELAPRDAQWWEAFRRTEIVDRRRPQGYTSGELADFSAECAVREGSLLVICNTKAEAKVLFTSLESRWEGELYHLSTAMCTAHRRETLDAVNRALDRGSPVICVSTQLVEAGVDFSFGCVIRVSAGMENIVQAAGRCNRSGEKGRICPVYIVNIRGENLSRLKEIRQSQQAAESLLLRYQRNPEAYGRDLTGKEAIDTYYDSLYGEMEPDARDYPLSGSGTTLLDLLSENRQSRYRCPTGKQYILGQALRTAGESFQVFEDNTRDVLVPYRGGKERIDRLGEQQNRRRAKYDLAYRGELLQGAASYYVSLYEYELRSLQKAGGLLDPLGDGSVLAVAAGFYSEETGFYIGGEVSTFI